MKVIVNSLLVLLFLVISSCSTIKPYPVCFSNCTNIKEETRKKIIEKLAEYLKLESKEVIVHPNLKWILAKTNARQHKRLIKTWPRMACIGDMTTGTEVTANSQCIEYIYDLLKNKNYLKLDIKANPVYSDEAPGKPNVICCCEISKP